MSAPQNPKCRNKCLVIGITLWLTQILSYAYLLVVCNWTKFNVCEMVVYYYIHEQEISHSKQKIIYDFICLVKLELIDRSNGSYHMSIT